MSPKKTAKNVEFEPAVAPTPPPPVDDPEPKGMPEVPTARPLAPVLDQDGRPIKPTEVWPESDWRHLVKAMTLANGYAVGVFLGCQRCGSMAAPTVRTGDGSWLVECGCLTRRWQRD